MKTLCDAALTNNELPLRVEKASAQKIAKIIATETVGVYSKYRVALFQTL